MLDEAGVAIPGLYASGNATASVMGRTYPGAGASIGASAIFSYISACHVADRRRAAVPEKVGARGRRQPKAT